MYKTNKQKYQRRPEFEVRKFESQLFHFSVLSGLGRSITTRGSLSFSIKWGWYPSPKVMSVKWNEACESVLKTAKHSTKVTVYYYWSYYWFENDSPPPKLLVKKRLIIVGEFCRLTIVSSQLSICRLMDNVRQTQFLERHLAIYR